MKALSLLVALLLVSSLAQAQQRLDMPELGASVEIPAAWKQTKTYNVTSPLPEMGVYHLMNLENGQGISLRQDECSASDRRAWIRGELAEVLHPGDVLKPLSGKESVRFDEHKGFEIWRRGPDYKAYVFYLAKGKRCYEVTLSSPEGIFGESESLFQQLVDSIRFASTIPEKR